VIINKRIKMSINPKIWSGFSVINQFPQISVAHTYADAFLSPKFFRDSPQLSSFLGPVLKPSTEHNGFLFKHLDPILSSKASFHGEICTKSSRKGEPFKTLNLIDDQLTFFAGLYRDRLKHRSRQGSSSDPILQACQSLRRCSL
jgi:hypothetical protein